MIKKSLDKSSNETDGGKQLKQFDETESAVLKWQKALWQTETIDGWEQQELETGEKQSSN